MSIVVDTKTILMYLMSPHCCSSRIVEGNSDLDLSGETDQGDSVDIEDGNKILCLTKQFTFKQTL